MAPCCPPDHGPVLSGTSLLSLVWPARATQRLGLPPSVSLWSLAGVPWLRAWLQPGNHQPPSMALCPNHEPIGEGRVRTSESTRSRPRPLWVEKPRHRKTKGPAAGLHRVLWSSLSADTAVPGGPRPCSVGAGMGRGPLEGHVGRFVFCRGVRRPSKQGARGWGQQEGGLGISRPPSLGGCSHLCWWVYLMGPLTPTVPHSLAPRGVQHTCAHNAREQLTALRTSVCCVCVPEQRTQQSCAQPPGMAVEDSNRRGAGDSCDLRLGPVETVPEKPP